MKQVDQIQELTMLFLFLTDRRYLEKELLRIPILEPQHGFRQRH